MGPKSLVSSFASPGEIPHSNHSSVGTGTIPLNSALYSPGISILLFFSFFLFTTAPAAYERSQARGQIGAAAAGLHHSHSNMGSEPHPQPMPLLAAMPDP